MSTSEALSTIPGLARDSQGESTAAGSMLVQPHVAEGTRAVLHIEADRIAEVALEIDHCKDAEATLVGAWGRPLTGTFRRGEPDRPFWASSETGWVASLETPYLGHNRGCRITFTSAAYFGSAASLPGVLGRLRFGMTQREINAQTGGFWLDEGPVRLTGVDGTSARLKADPEGRLDEIEVWVPAPALKAIELAWGLPSPVDPDAKIWFDEPRFDDPQRQRARIRNGSGFENEVLFGAFLPAEAWFGEGLKIAVFPDRLLGESVAEFIRQHEILTAGRADPNPREFMFELPATRWGDAHTLITLSATDGIISSAHWLIWFATASERDALLALFERKWGPPTARALGWKFAYEDMEVFVHDHRDRFEITVDRDASDAK